jgi:hypothetical protein
MKGIIHRDIKPGNIFISSFGDFKLGDFGIAREMDKAGGSMSTKIGTPAYMAPEIAVGIRYDNTVDIYSLGIVLYRFLNHNRLPFIDQRLQEITYNDQETAILRRHRGEPLPAPAEASRQMADIILTACRYNPAMRYRSAAELKSALESVKNPAPLNDLLITCAKCGAGNTKGSLFCITCGNNLKKKSGTPKIAIIAGVVCISVIALVFLLMQLDSIPSRPDSPAPTAAPPGQTSQTEPPTVPPPEPTVPPADVQSISILHEDNLVTDVSLYMGEIITLHITIEPSDADVDIVWTSSDTGIFDFIVIDTSGISATLEGKFSGDAELSVRAGKIVQTCIINVIAPTLVPDEFTHPRLRNLYDALQNMNDRIYLRFNWTDGPHSGRTSDLEWIPSSSQWRMYGVTGNDREVFPEFSFNGNAIKIFWPRAPRRSYYLFEFETGYFAETDGSDSESFTWELWIEW